MSNKKDGAAETYLLAKIAKICKIISCALMGLQFLWECSKDASSHRDVTWYDVYFGKGAELKEMQNIVIETWNYPYNENEN